MILNKNTFLTLILLALAGCASYQPLPLPSQPDLSRKVPHLRIPDSQLPLRELQSHPFNPSDGLDMTEIAMLAVVNNPELKQARDEVRVSRAQAFAAGLLPDPQLNLARDTPTSKTPGLVAAFNAGLNFDVTSLITHATAVSAAKSESSKTDLNLLWQEWQVVAKARTLFVQVTEQQKQMVLLQQSRHIAQDRYDRVQRSVMQGNETQDALLTNLSALQDIERQTNDLERALLKSRHELNALLGLSPELQLDLTGPAELPELSPNKVQLAMHNLPRSRPDLLALQAGYRAQDARYRQAILAQFPALTIGFTRARDTSAIYTHGIAVTLSLPFFNGNRGNIAIEQATRQKLRDEYQSRLNQAYSDVERILREQTVLQRQRQEIDHGLAELERAGRHADTALQEGNIDFLAYSALQSSLLAKRMEAIMTEQALLEQRVALQGLVGGELPVNKGAQQ